MSNMQQEVESIQAELALHKTRLEKVRARVDEAEASNNSEELKQLQALELELLGLIRELQAEKNRLSSQSGALSMREWLKQRLPRMPSRVSDRASSSATRAANARSLSDVEPWSSFGEQVKQFIDTLPDTPKMFKPLSFNIVLNEGEGEREVMLSGAADEAYVRSRLITTLEAVSQVAEHLGLDVEYVDGGSGRSLSFTDMLVRKRGVSDRSHPSKLVIGVVEVKGFWQLQLDGSRSLLDCLQDEKLGPSVANVIQQAYGDSVMDECPLILISNWHSTSVLVRDTTDVSNKKLKAAHWGWDSTQPHPLGALLYVLQLAHAMWHDQVKLKLPRSRVPVTPSSGYIFSCGSRQVLLHAKSGGVRDTPARQLPMSSSKRNCQVQDAGDVEPGSKLTVFSHSPHHPELVQPISLSGVSSLQLQTFSSSTSSSSRDSSRDSSTGGGGTFDALSWSESAATRSAVTAIDGLPILPPDYASYSGQALCSTSKRRVCEGLVDGQAAAFKLFNPEDPHSLQAFVTEATTYVRLMASGAAYTPKLLALGRLPHSGVPVLAVTLGRPVIQGLLQQHADAARSCLQQLHNAGFAHGDVRTENFLLIDGQVVIIDLERCAKADEEAFEIDMERLQQCLSG